MITPYLILCFDTELISEGHEIDEADKGAKNFLDEEESVKPSTNNWVLPVLHKPKLLTLQELQ